MDALTLAHALADTATASGLDPIRVKLAIEIAERLLRDRECAPAAARPSAAAA